MRRRVGAFDVAALTDGWVRHARRRGPPHSAGERRAAAGRDDPAGSAAADCHRIPAQAGRRVAFVDVGAGASMGADCGHLLGNLRAAGILPEQVDMVILTHIHPEHSNGLVGAAGAAVFPRAELVIPREDFKFWVETDPDAAAERFRRNMMAARRAIAPYRERIRLIDDEEAMPGVAALPLPGHTPGHTGWMVESEGGESCGSGTGNAVPRLGL
jgi:glyoxylase-like metal-dependent hydrolase (beta-lactamase superfamily II)